MRNKCCQFFPPLHQLAEGLIWNKQHREDYNMRLDVINCDVFIAGDDHEDVAFVMQRLFSNVKLS